MLSRVTRPRVLVSWSSGKDGAWALHELRRADDVDVVGLLTVVNIEHDRVAMHAVRSELLRAQADAVGLPLSIIPLRWPSANEDYEAAMAAAIADAARAGVTAIAFGDLFLADIRAYRERQLAGTGLTPLFPLWGRPTDKVVREMIAAGLRARITCVDPRQAPRELVGRDLDLSLVAALPPGVDPCGERGEFHTFAWDGPGFRAPVPIETGRVVERDGFVFADLRPA
jgi:uncharacterized protein (TIGR00290 family)